MAICKSFIVRALRGVNISLAFAVFALIEDNYTDAAVALSGGLTRISWS